VIAFCTTIMNRRWQLERTLAHNLKQLKAERSQDCILALVNYNSTDGLDDMIRRSFREEIEAGRLRYFHTEVPTVYHASRAKNLAHRLALGHRQAPDILFNLDADNLLAPGTVAMVRDTFATKEDVCLHNWSLQQDDGSFGRIALRAATWKKLGGYDESFEPMAFEDADLLIRCRANKIRYALNHQEIPFPIYNSIAQKLANVGPNEAGEDDYTRYSRMYRRNFIRGMMQGQTLKLSDQQPFLGRVNFSEEQEI
jgi:hypothetical protein